MIDSVDVARWRMCTEVDALGSERVMLERACGRTLAEPVYAHRDQPPFRSAAMDGYALRRVDLQNDRELQIVGISAAGARYSGIVCAGEAVRIFTGAPVPDGADCVVPQERAISDGRRLHAMQLSSDHIRQVAVDFTAGDKLIEQGTRLDAFSLALAAASGRAELVVSKVPRIALLAMGNELVVPGRKAGADQIYDSASFGIAALIMQWGGEPLRLALQPDSIDAIRRSAEVALSEADLLVTIGGASVGDHDLARDALACLQLETIVSGIAMKPGKPTWFGRAAPGRVLGLPGNPVAALVCAHLLLRPLMDKMLGRDLNDSVPSLRARTARPLEANRGFERYVRARIEPNDEGCLIAQDLEQQDTSVLSAILPANALIRQLPGTPAVAAGQRVDVISLERR